MSATKQSPAYTEWAEDNRRGNVSTDTYDGYEASQALQLADHFTILASDHRRSEQVYNDLTILGTLAGCDTTEAKESEISARAKAEAYEHAATLIRARFAPDESEFIPEPPADGLPF